MCTNNNKTDIAAKRLKLSKTLTSLFVCLKKYVKTKISWWKNNKKSLAKRRVLLVQFSRICIRLAERERESWTRGVRTEEKRKEKKQKQEDRINVGRVCTTAGKPECSFFFPPLSLQLCLSLPLHFSFSNHWLSLCQHAEGPPIWHWVSNSPANTHAPSAEREGRERWQREKQRGGG